MVIYTLLFANAVAIMLNLIRVTHNQLRSDFNIDYAIPYHEENKIYAYIYISARLSFRQAPMQILFCRSPSYVAFNSSPHSNSLLIYMYICFMYYIEKQLRKECSGREEEKSVDTKAYWHY